VDSWIKIKFFPRQVFLCSPTNALLSATLMSFDQALKAGHAKTSKFNALWIFSSQPQGRLVKRHYGMHIKFIDYQEHLLL